MTYFPSRIAKPPISDVYINEMAPHSRNSDYCAIEACETSQFATHFRTIPFSPLGSTDLEIPYPREGKTQAARPPSEAMADGTSGATSTSPGFTDTHPPVGIMIGPVPDLLLMLSGCPSP